MHSHSQWIPTMGPRCRFRPSARRLAIPRHPDEPAPRARQAPRRWRRTATQFAPPPPRDATPTLAHRDAARPTATPHHLEDRDTTPTLAHRDTTPLLPPPATPHHLDGLEPYREGAFTITWLITGGAGYIGAHVVRAMRGAGSEVVVLDDLSTGMRGRVPDDVPLAVASIADLDRVRQTLVDHRVTGVVHLAAKKAVEESVARPLTYYRENVEGLRRLLEAMVAEDVGRLVYSSSAAVYGIPPHSPVTEDAPTVPINPYGQTKLAGEWLADAVGRTTGMRTVSLRYFNVAGAGAPELGDPGVANLVPLALRALATGQPPKVFGDDYPTPDGTCVRDYIHVADLATAHVAAAAAIDEEASGRVYNVSRGVGASVREVLATAGAVTGIDLDAEVVDRRPGDPPELVGDATAIEQELGWRAGHDLTDMLASAWQASATAADAG